MTKPIGTLICFPPGAGGNFVASLIKHLHHGNSIQFGKLGDAHANHIPWLSTHLNIHGFDDSLENFIFEFFEIKKASTHEIVVAHTRNLVQCLKYAQQVVYIDFELSSVNDIKQKGAYKNNVTKLPEVSYNQIKGESWPSYQEFLDGAEVPELNDHIQSPMERWYWVLPKAVDNLHCIMFEEIFGPDNSWIYQLGDFLNLKVTNSAFEFWAQYKNLQASRQNK